MMTTSPHPGPTQPLAERPSQPPVLEIRQLSKSYGRRQVLDRISLSVQPGEIVGLLGQNGAGKSTLLRCLLGLSHLSSGMASVFGTSASRLGADEKCRIGYVPQLPKLQTWMRVRQLVDYVSAFYPSWDGARSDALARRWELGMDQRIAQLSPGEQQRLSLLLALGHRPRLLVLDEPAASLDPIARREAMTSLLEAASEDRATILLSTHLTSDLERIANRILILREGRLQLDGDLGDLKDVVKRLRLVAPAIPADLRVPGTIASTRQADGMIITVRGSVAEACAQLRAIPGASVVVEDLSLEEIFLELHR